MEKKEKNKQTNTFYVKKGGKGRRKKRSENWRNGESC